MSDAVFRRNYNTDPLLHNGSRRMPIPGDFGLTEEDLKRSHIFKKGSDYEFVLVLWSLFGFPLVCVLLIPMGTDVEVTILGGLIFTFVVGFIIIALGKRIKLKGSFESTGSKISRYQEALRKWEIEDKKLAEQYWRIMDGWQFEHAIAELYRKLGYEADVTPGSGDHGVDIHLKKDGKYFVVQCKQQSNRVSPHIVRDLFGTMHAEKADGAILVCTSGFSDDSKKWSSNKPIQFIDMDGILKMERATL